MRTQSGDEMIPVESFFQYIVEEKHAFRYLVFQETVCQPEIIFIIQYVQVVDDTLVSDVSVCEAHHLVEDGQSITHTSVGLLGDDIQGFRFGFHMLLEGHAFQVFHHVADTDPVEIINLAAAQDRRKDLMLFSGRQDEDCMMRRFFQRFEEGIEGRL